MSEKLTVVGKRLPAWAAFEKVTGAAKFTVDTKLPGMLVGKVLTSPHPHAKIKRIDKSKAEKLPGVEAVITWDDVPHKLFNPSHNDLSLHQPENELKDMYVISEKARFVGDIIAAVAAVDEATAEEALSLIVVEYEVLPAVFDPIEAMKPGAPTIHDFAKNNVSLHSKFPVSLGDVEKGFEESDIVVEATFKTSKQHLSQFEPCSCVASFDASGRLTIWAHNQRPFIVRTKLAGLFDMPEGMVRWITPHMGGGFGKKANSGVDPICIALAKKTGKPVKMEFTREEDFLSTATRESFIESGKMGVKNDGTIIALEQRLTVNSGAYFNRSSAVGDVCMAHFTGVYRCPNSSAEMDAVYTNLPISGGMRGYGIPEACFLLDQLIDIAAEKLGMDPLELRLKNLKKLGDPSQVGVPLETYTQEKCIRLGAERIGWKEKRARKKENGTKRCGIGMCIYFDVSGAQPFHIQDRNVFIKLNEDGSANLTLGVSDIGQNLIGTSAQIAAEVLGLRYEDIHIVAGDTDNCLFDAGTYANNGSYILGNAVMKVATEVKKQVTEQAAKRLGVSPDELDIKDRKVFVRADPSKDVAVTEICKGAIYNHEGQHLHISAKGSFPATQNPSPVGAVFADVEVDIETGEVKILKLLLVHDCGKQINPATVEGQLEGAMALGIGYALFEDFYVNTKDGRLESDNFNTYKLPAALDLPDMEVIVLDEPVPSGPFGAKGVGMSGVMGVAPAIANAVYDAVGIRIEDMPLTPEKLLRALKNR
jgi:xanthine dehydrogenase molybdenum-binding subunit